MAFYIDSPTKKARKEPMETCIIHMSSAQNDPQIRTMVKNSQSWDPLLDAAKIRNFKPILDLAAGCQPGEIPDVKYHKNCRSMFVMKKNLERIQNQQSVSGETQSDEELVRKSARKSDKNAGRLFDDNCIFCDKKVRYIKANKKEIAQPCSTKNAEENIKKWATLKNDTKILALASRELLAGEARYHRTCQKDYTRECEEKSEVHEMSDYEEISFNKIFEFLRRDLFQNPRIIKFKELSDKLFENMMTNGAENIDRKNKKVKLKKMLEIEFDKSLHFIVGNRGKLLICPNTLTFDMLVIENQSMKEELYELKAANSDDKEGLKRAALVIRDKLRTHKMNISWPPKPQELRTCSTVTPYPVEVTEFVTDVVIDKSRPKSKSLSKRSQCMIDSICADLIYAASNGEIKPPKHILLPFSIKSLSGNVEIIRILNNFGHCLSYTQMEEIETALCIDKINSQTEGQAILPQDIHHYLPTTLAFDNIDRLEETLTGGGTSHRVNGIIVQQKFQGPYPENEPEIVPKKNDKKRSINPIHINLPVYNSGQRKGPSRLVALERDYKDCAEKAFMKNFIWVVSRMHAVNNLHAQEISAWTGFNIKISNNEVCQDRVEYLPTINAPATDLSTVNEILNQSELIRTTLKLEKIAVVLDLALYAKAAEIKWKFPDRLKHITLRMGVFHTVCVNLKIIGKKFGDAGLKDLLIEGGIVAGGSVSAVLEGRHYNRAVRSHKLVYEALLRIIWKGFQQWFEARFEEESQRFDDALTCINDLRDNLSSEEFITISNNDSVVYVFNAYKTYLQYLRNNGKMSRFWMSYIDMVEDMLGLIRASREGNWLLHLKSIRSLIPWCFAFGNMNYARYLPVYFAEMSRLETDSPFLYNYMLNGGFSVQLTPNNAFARLPVDQTTEMTVNKDTQTPGGTKGFSLKPGALSRHYLTADVRSEFLRQIRELSSLNSSPAGSSHADLGKSRMHRDESDVQNLTSLLENDWTNPFNNSLSDEDIICLSTGTVAPLKVVDDMINAQTRGEEEYTKFKNERLESLNPTKKFHDPIHNLKLQTFSSMAKKKQTLVKGQEIMLRADRNLFAHMIIMAKSRGLEIKDVLCHPLGPIPWSLGTTDGSIRKTDKSSLGREFEKDVLPVENIPINNTYIIDGMALVQKVNADNKTFFDVAVCILSIILSLGKDSERIDVVFDTYRDVSIKNLERDRRGSQFGIKYKKLEAGHKVQQWNKFLSNGSNKNALIEFLTNEWQKKFHRDKLTQKVLLVTCGDKCLKISSDLFTEIEELHCTHEEADTRLLLHAKNASTCGASTIIIDSEDTDVFVLCLSFQNSIHATLLLKRGTQNRRRYINIQDVALKLGQSTCNALIGMHVYTGCDTVSSFSGKGKLSSLKITRKSEKYQVMFESLGSTWTISEQLLDDLEAFTCELYSSKITTHDVNDLRYQLFRSKKGEMESHQLPPCRDTLRKHATRANYQAAIMKRSLLPQPNIPEPQHHGWLKVGQDLGIDWMEGDPAPVAVLELMSCKCLRQCGQNCICVANGLKCTDLCRLQTCTNQEELDTDNIILNSASDEDNDDDDDVDDDE